MAKASRLSSGNWRCSVYIGVDETGKKKYKSFTGENRRRVEFEASEYEDRMKGIRKGTSVESAVDEYIALRKGVLSPSTLRGYTNIQNYLKEAHGAFCALPVASLNRRIMQNLIADMASEGASAKTIANRIGLINSAMREKGYTIPKITMPERQKPDLKIPDTADVQNIIKASEGTEMEIPVLLAAFAPMRRSEICALTMDDIEGNTIHVRRAIVMDAEGRNVEKGTKTYESNRRIPMDEKIIDKIRKKGYITKIKNPQHISQRFEHIAIQAGCKGTRFHDLRHWCASYLHARGVPDQYIMARGGWKTDRVLKAVYRHELESERSKWSETINDNFRNIIENA